MTPPETLAERLKAAYPALGEAQAALFAREALTWVEEQLPGVERLAFVLFDDGEANDAVVWRTSDATSLAWYRDKAAVVRALVRERLAP